MHSSPQVQSQDAGKHQPNQQPEKKARRQMTSKHSFYLLTFFAEKTLRKGIMKLIVQDLKIRDV